MEKEIKKKLSEGFVRILNKKQTVTLLCEKAEISRATFYLYYKNFDDFYEKTEQEIIGKFFDQIILLMFCDDSRLEKNIKKQNCLLNETERKLLSFYAEGKNYMSFAMRGFKNSIPAFDDFCKEKFGEEFFCKNSFVLHYCFNAVATLLFFDLIDYDESKLIFEITQARKIINSLLC